MEYRPYLARRITSPDRPPRQRLLFVDTKLFEAGDLPRFSNGSHASRTPTPPIMILGRDYIMGRLTEGSYTGTC